MYIYVANPLYDSVFKYLMEDERIARTMFSALLQKQVVKVQMRRHEYSNIMRESVSMFRIDFGATIVEDDGTERLILIELQKTWLETETLRFRQYLGVQYNNKENMLDDSNGKYALPTVAVYLLGHRVGDINEPVVYARHKIYDYDGNEVQLAHPDPFVESLQHDSIIVQIPLLRGKVNNRLEKVFSVFDQSQISEKDAHVIQVSKDSYRDDDEMKYIITRLQSAIADPEVRSDMMAEDEFFKAIEDRDTELLRKEKLLKQKDEALQQKDEALQQKDEALQQKDEALQLKDEALHLKDEALRSAVLALHQTGISVANIAKATGITVEDIEAIIG